VARLFVGHPDLIVGFNSFLPPEVRSQGGGGARGAEGGGGARKEAGGRKKPKSGHAGLAQVSCLFCSLLGLFIGLFGHLCGRRRAEYSIRATIYRPLLTFIGLF
jgi:hypothetical protein